MSDIPVGSPPVPPGRHAAPGGWYADPVDQGRERYWDGWQWSRNTRPREGQPPTGPSYATPVAPSPAPGSSQPPQSGYPSQPGYPPQPGYRGYPVAPGYGRPAGAAVATADGVPLSGWWWRVLATVIDNLLLTVVATALTVSVWLPVYQAFAAYFEAVVQAQQTGVLPPPLDPVTLVPPRSQFILTAVSLGLALVYQIGFLRWKGATPGKLACRLRVVPVDRGRGPGPLGWNAVTIRAAIWVLPGVSSLLALFSLLDALFPLWQPKRQALHDLAAKTQVVRLDRPAPR